MLKQGGLTGIVTSAHHKTPKRWERKVAKDLSEAGLPMVRVVRESFGESCPDVVQVPAGTVFDPRPYWELVQRVRLGPLVGECKTRRHVDVPAYLIKAIKDYDAAPVFESRVLGATCTRRVPLWIREMLSQVRSYRKVIEVKPALCFVAIRKKRGRGSGSGLFDFVIVVTNNFREVTKNHPQGITWGDLSVLSYSKFLSQMWGFGKA